MSPDRVCPAFELGQKPARIFLGKAPLVDRLKRDVLVGREGDTSQGGLTGLPRSGESHHRIVASIADEIIFEQPVFQTEFHVANLRFDRKFVKVSILIHSIHKWKRTNCSAII